MGLAQNEALNRAMTLEYDQPDSAISIIEQLITEDRLDQRSLSNAYEIMGIAQWVKKQNAAAIQSHWQALAIRQAIDFRVGIEHSYNNLGLNYRELGDPKSAMENFLLAQKMAEQLPDSLMLAKVLGNIGTLYEDQNADDEALKYHGMSLKILESGLDQRVLANTLYNIALIYNKNHDLEKAKNFALRSHAIRTLMQDTRSIAQSLNLLGLIASGAGSIPESDSLFISALEIYTDVNDVSGMSMVHGNLGENAIDRDDLPAAIDHCSESLRMARTHRLEWELSACQCLARAYSQIGNGNKAVVYWQRVLAMKDSIAKLNALTEISVLQRKFEFEKEQLQAEAEIKRQKLLRQASIGLGMAGILLFLMAFYSYRNKQRDNDLLETKNAEISEQKAEIEEKSKHITDSITYAKNLQTAILPKHEMFARHFSDFHILYRPKDIVSGDFYWMESLPLAPSQRGGTVIYLAVADCTGHGVPGAMVSMIGFQGLNKAVIEEGLTSPAAILQRLSDHVEDAFGKSGGSVKDGMDICLVAIDTESRQVTYSGAHNALWILTSTQELPQAVLKEEAGEKRLFECKADRRSIGGYFDAGPFTESSFNLNQGDRLFLFSDGFADQFGGPQGKKLGSKRMRELFFQKAIDGQFASIDAAFEQWKSSEEQIDDVTIISIVV